METKGDYKWVTSFNTLASVYCAAVGSLRNADLCSFRFAAHTRQFPSEFGYEDWLGAWVEPSNDVLKFLRWPVTVNQIKGMDGEEIGAFIRSGWEIP